LTDEKILDYWNDLYSKDNFFGTGPTKLAILAQSLINQDKIHSILELGCGQGRDAIFLSQIGHNIEAIDISSRAIDFVNNTKDFLGINSLKASVGDISKPFKFHDNYFDLVYSNLALQFFDIEQMRLIFENISKVLKKDSKFLFSTKKEGDKYYNTGKQINDHAFENKGIIRYFFSSNELKNLLLKHFEILQFESDEHTNLDSTVSVWWKILVQKK
jgi:SAM-dependent methyltransferase